MSPTGTAASSISPRDVFEGIYTQFILRDVMAKVVPGITLLVAGAYAMGLDTFPALPGWAGWALVGLAWILGFVIQGVGQMLRLILHEPSERHLLYVACLKLAPSRTRVGSKGPRPDDQRTDHRRRLDFIHATKGSPHHAQQRERYLVIKEAAGNSYVCALLVSAILALSLRSILAWAVAIPFGVGIVLLYVHMTYVHRQWNWEEEILREGGPSEPGGDPDPQAWGARPPGGDAVGA